MHDHYLRHHDSDHHQYHDSDRHNYHDSDCHHHHDSDHYQLGVQRDHLAYVPRSRLCSNFLQVTTKILLPFNQLWFLYLTLLRVGPV